MKSLLYPKLRLDLLPAMLGYAVLGACVAGLYGGSTIGLLTRFLRRISRA